MLPSSPSQRICEKSPASLEIWMCVSTVIGLVAFKAGLWLLGAHHGALEPLVSSTQSSLLASLLNEKEWRELKLASASFFRYFLRLKPSWQAQALWGLSSAESRLQTAIMHLSNWCLCIATQDAKKNSYIRFNNQKRSLIKKACGWLMKEEEWKRKGEPMIKWSSLIKSTTGEADLFFCILTTDYLL